MASPDKDVGSSPGSAWASILQAVREQLPSLDSDSSLSDFGEEELFIFQRNHPALIPDLSEELAEEPAGSWDMVAHSSPPAAGLVPVGFGEEPWSEWNAQTGRRGSPEGKDPGSPLAGHGKASSSPGVPEDTPRWQEGDLAVTTSKARGALSLPKGPKGEATFAPLKRGLDAESQRPAPHGGEDPNCARRQALRRERRRMIEKDVLHRVSWEACAPGSAPAPLPPRQEPQKGPPTLSLQQLEESDLDGLLQRLAGPDRTPGAPWQASDRLQHQVSPTLSRSTIQWRHLPRPQEAQAAQLCPHPTADTEHSAHDRLMERLVLLCASQSRAYASAWNVPAASPPDSRPLEATTRRSSGELDAPGVQGMRPKSEVEPPTVFMDLRVPEPPAQATEESSSSSSLDGNDEDDEDEESAAPEGDQQDPGGLWDRTGKSQLLQQLRAFRQGLPPPVLPAPGGPGGPGGQKGQAPAHTSRSAAWRRNTGALGEPPELGVAKGALGLPLEPPHEGS
ncbi:dynein axonemal assembly factor 8 [Sorex fumeus]|uniref:dynein axonemal assembly factor 8 n=1 Tax=Sorex fumeus TaxID=62283 RepID=UPI0024AE6CA9|nr:dynein axonemal assembly factor 8 [Sorex fumeus]